MRLLGIFEQELTLLMLRLLLCFVNKDKTRQDGGFVSVQVLGGDSGTIRG